jgi:hypothetical protein
VTQLALDPAETGADLSSDLTYRYLLWRRWAVGPACLFIMLNPSTADDAMDDPTIRRCIGFAREWGYASLEVANLFAVRATRPGVLYRHPDPIGERNDECLREASRRCDRVVCAWGNHGRLAGRGTRVLAGLLSMRVRPWCLGLTKSGQPIHPLYQPVGKLPTRIWMEPA